MKVGIDTGGTFTDSVCWEDGRLRLGKVLSTPRDPARSVANALGEAAGRSDVELQHGTTVATNALLERKGARTAMVTNRGFEDVLEIARGTRPELYSLLPRRPAGLVPPELRFGVTARIGPQGQRWTELGPGELERLVEDVANAGAEAVAVCLLHSWRDGGDEAVIGRALERLGIPISLSSNLLPRFREYERASTTTVNAYLQPRLGEYLRRVDGLAGRATVMLSSGGVMPAAEAGSVPARLLLSGPAAGVIGSGWLGARLHTGALLTFDMGGTSTDVSVVDGTPRLSSETEIDGLAVALPMVEIHTVGAGGGSIARLDSGGGLRVGPESAGAEPGPACYGRSDVPTVTDANLVLGRLPGDLRLAGTLRLDVESARRAVGNLASRAGLRLEEAAEGIVRVVNANMEAALRVVTVRRGIDPRPMTLVAFGGAGALHAAALAEGLGIRRVLVPALAGTLSALGLVVADRVRHLTQSLLMPLSAEGMDRARRWFEAQERDEADHESLREVEARYVGQSFELTVPFTLDPKEIADAFHEAHRRRFGTVHAAPIELVHLSLRLLERGVAEDLPSAELEVGVIGASSAPIWQQGRVIEVPRVEQWRMKEGESVDGPAVLTSPHATGFLPSGWRAISGPDKNLWMERR